MPASKRAPRKSSPDSVKKLSESAAQPVPANRCRKNMAVRRAPPRVFLLSPAHAGGTRARWLLNPQAPFALAQQFQREGLSLAEVFAFASGLYFRGKITYAKHFARPGDLVRVITSNAGLLDPATHIGPAELVAFGDTEIHEGDLRYLRPLRRDAKAVDRLLKSTGHAILLGSIATPKYRESLLEIFGERLLFPSDFVGRGDMSRGALLLRATKANHELDYQSVQGAVWNGRRAVKAAEIRPGPRG